MSKTYAILGGGGSFGIHAAFYLLDHANPNKVVEVVITGIHYQQVGLIGHGGCKTHVGTKQHRQNKGFRRLAELLGNTNCNRCTDDCGSVVGHHVGQHCHHQ